jgi:hypothetical protein
MNLSKAFYTCLHGQTLQFVHNRERLTRNCNRLNAAWVLGKYIVVVGLILFDSIVPLPVECWVVTHVPLSVCLFGLSPFPISPFVDPHQISKPTPSLFVFTCLVASIYVRTRGREILTAIAPSTMMSSCIVDDMRDT